MFFFYLYQLFKWILLLKDLKKSNLEIIDRTKYHIYKLNFSQNSNAFKI